MSKELIHAITDMREEDAVKIATGLLDKGTDPLVILEDCRVAMEMIGKRFETGESFIPELILAGEDTEIDRSVIEKIKDPLIHLLRNAVDHGIEAPDERVAAGKPPAGAPEKPGGEDSGSREGEDLGNLFKQPK